MLQSLERQPTVTAVVSKTAPAGPEYLRLGPDGAAFWVADPSTATPFGSMREAARMALRLPARLRAFGMPLQIERELYQLQRVH
jgi:hypothetical protein